MVYFQQYTKNECIEQFQAFFRTLQKLPKMNSHNFNQTRTILIQQRKIKNEDITENEKILFELLNSLSELEISESDQDGVQNLLEDISNCIFEIDKKKNATIFNSFPDIFAKLFEILDSYNEDYIKRLVLRIMLHIADSKSDLFVKGVSSVDFPAFVALHLQDPGFSVIRNLLALCTYIVTNKELRNICKDSILLQVIVDFAQTQQPVITAKERQCFVDAVNVIELFVADCDAEECSTFFDSFGEFLCTFLNHDSDICVERMLKILSKLAHHIPDRIIQETDSFEKCLTFIIVPQFTSKETSRYATQFIIEILNNAKDITKPGLFENFSVDAFVHLLEYEDADSSFRRYIISLLTTFTLKTTEEIFNALVTPEVLGKLGINYETAFAGERYEIIYFYWATASRVNYGTFMELYEPYFVPIMLTVFEYDDEGSLITDIALPLLKGLLQSQYSDILPTEDIKEAIETAEDSSSGEIWSRYDEILQLEVFKKEP